MCCDGKGVRKVYGGKMAAETARVQAVECLAPMTSESTVGAQDCTARELAARSNPVCLARFRL